MTTSPEVTAMLVLAFLWSCAHPAPPAAAPRASVDGELGARIDDVVGRLSAFGVSGVLLVADHGHVVVERGYGTADRGDGAAITADTPFVIGSLSKQFTAAAVLLLDSRGKLRLDDPVTRFFPDAPEPMKAVTVASLLDHTSGLPYLPPYDMAADAQRADVMRAILALPLATPPGQFSYSTPGYTLLSGIVEAASGERYEDFVARELFAKAGMTHTGFLGDARWQGVDVHSYTGDGDEGALSDWPRMDGAVGAGTVVSTVGDLYAWVTALRTDTVLPAAEREQLWTPHTPTDWPNTQHGYGWNISATSHGTAIGHAGDLGGWNAECRYYVDRDLVTIFLSNTRSAVGVGYRQVVLDDVSLLAAGDPFPAPPPVAHVDVAALSEKAGRYVLPSGAAVDVTVDGDHLVATADGADAVAVLAGADPSAGDVAKDLDRQTSAIADGVARGDFAALEGAMHPSLPVSGVEPALQALVAADVGRLGAYGSTEVIGTAVLSPKLAKTYFRWTFERGSVVEAYSWVGGRILGFEDDLPGAMATSFVPTGADGAAAFDPITGKTVTVAFSDDSLSLTTSAGTVTASRGS